MELTLNVYNGQDIEKTYTTRSCRLTMGVCEDLLEIMSNEKLLNMEKYSDEDAVAFMPMVGRIFKHARSTITRVFPEMTDDEYDRLDPGEVVQFVMKSFTYTFTQLDGASSKN